MRREEKRRRFHESLLNTLYPPASQPQSEENEEKPITNFGADFDVDLIPDDYGLRASGSSKSDEDDDSEKSDCEAQMLSRAQRKRLRKKKLKEDISRRKQMIGPLLPSPSFDGHGGCGSATEECTSSVRQNAHETHGAAGSQSKLKQRRKAKKLAKERLKASDSNDCVQDQSFEPINAGPQ